MNLTRCFAPAWARRPSREFVACLRVSPRKRNQFMPVPRKENAGPHANADPAKGKQMSNDVMDRIATPAEKRLPSTQPKIGRTRPPEVDLAAIVRRCRLKIAEQYKLHGDSHASAAVACSAIRCWRATLWPAVWRRRRLIIFVRSRTISGTTKRCGADVVDTCIGVGAALYAELEEVYARRDERVAA